MNSCSWKRSEAPAQCVVEPPTALTIQAGRLGKSLAHAPGARRGAHVRPGELGEALPFVVDEVLDLVARAGLEHDHLDALLRELVGERAAAGAGADDDDDAYRRSDRILQPWTFSQYRVVGASG